MTILTETPPAREPAPQAAADAAVRLVDGSVCDLDSLSRDALIQLQWEQETAFAQRIKASPKNSAERTATIKQAYETVCAILCRISELDGHGQFAMGMDDRYADLVLKQLAHLRTRSLDGGLFELGFGAGTLLEAASSLGYRVGGLEVAEQLHRVARRRVTPANRDNLLIGGFVGHPGLDRFRETFSVVYWNDVFEHIPVDEIGDYLAQIHSLLMAGGALITITPNWHMRPMDVTGDFMPPRSEAIGFHLKEYKLSEVRQLLLDAGFSAIDTPLFVGKNRILYHSLPGATRLKCLLEPALERAPYWLAVQVCRRLGLCCTVATK